MFPYGKKDMSKIAPPPSRSAPTATPSRINAPVNTGGAGKSSRLVRYPTQSNALRALLDASPPRPSLIFRSPMAEKAQPHSHRKTEKPSPSERSKPSPGALALLFNHRITPRTEDRPSRPAPVRIPDSAELGRLVRTKRVALKLTQQQLAERAGVGRRFICELEAGKPTIELGKALAACRALGLSLSAQDAND
ncbi:anaerobic benzoate catabolism transcriptional regulator [compost metagenome]